MMIIISSLILSTTKAFRLVSSKNQSLVRSPTLQADDGLTMKVHTDICTMYWDLEGLH